MPELDQIAKDPEFSSFSPIEKVHVLNALTPEFNGFSNAEKMRVIEGIDPKFTALPDSDKMRFMGELDPDFHSLSPQEKVMAYGAITGKPGYQPPQPEPGPVDQFMGGLSRSSAGWSLTRTLHQT